jgi:single-stranded-DNA-specific exonuclease
MPPVLQKYIRIRQQQPDIASDIASKFKLSQVASRILSARGFIADDILKNYITPSLKEGLPSPKGLKGIEVACSILKSARQTHSMVALASDFDVDGLSGAAQLYEFLTKAGIEVKLFVPDRFTDGYGLNSRMVRDAAAAGCSVLLTVDFGTKNEKELVEARKLGMKSIVVDHHHVGDSVVPADAFINPKQPGCGFAGEILCASGLAWYLVVALRSAFELEEFDVKNLLDLACLGTICDMVPLIGANRILARRGLEVLTQTRRAGLQALKKLIGAQGDVSCFDVSFGIGPRLNAAGRIVHGEVVVELLTTSDTDKASKLAKKLHDLNVERQELESLVKEEAIKEIEKKKMLPWGLAVWRPEFHTGVIGIVAQRLVESYYRPAAVMGKDADGILKGSVRGIKGFNVVEALQSVSSVLLKFGGHEGAGGFSVSESRVEDFVEAWNDECLRRLSVIECRPCVDADTEIHLGEFDVALVKEIKRFAPFGIGNSSPVVVTPGLKVLEVKSLKNAHLKATFTDGRRYVTGIIWRQAEHPLLKKGNTVNIAFRPEISTFGGIAELQANLQAVEEAA